MGDGIQEPRTSYNRYPHSPVLWAEATRGILIPLEEVAEKWGRRGGETVERADLAAVAYCYSDH